MLENVPLKLVSLGLAALLWFVIAGEKVYMRAQEYKVKVGLAAKGKACVAIDDGDKYRELRGVVMWGVSGLPYLSSFLTADLAPDLLLSPSTLVLAVNVPCILFPDRKFLI